MERQEVLDLIPAYALGALDPDDRAAVEAALADDPAARALLAEYEAVAQQLVTLAPLRPAPPHLQADLRERLAAERAAAPTQTMPAVRAARPPRTWRRWLLVAAAGLAVIVLGAALALTALREDDDYAAAQRLYTQLVEQPASTRYAIAPGEGTAVVRGDVVVSAEGDRAVLCAWDLPAIGAAQTFQLWLIDAAGARTSAGLFRPAHADDWVYYEIPLAQPVSAYQALGVSLEPAGGSPYPDQPTGPRVFGVPLA